MEQPLEILKKYFKFDSFRGLQQPIINSVLQGKDTLALMPTGGGKSICFQVPALAKEGICLVISPLIALMKDQVENLQKKDIKALAIVGSLSQNEILELLDNALYGNYKFLYLAPERLQQDWILQRITTLNINLVAIDEAHCVSQWGHDFRPAYLNIKELRQYLPQVPFLALTASATKRVQEDLLQQLDMKNPTVFRDSFQRENLSFQVLEVQDKAYRIEQILKQNPQPAIIYVRNRKSSIEIARNLEHVGIRATYFHGGLSFAEKEKSMNLWLQEKVQVIVATNAFGMGIDKPNVKTVIHIQLPENLENYYQEAGRAGRNREYAQAILLVNKHDVQIAENQFLSVLPDKQFLTDVYIKLFNYFQIAYGELPEERFSFSFNDFCLKYNLPSLKTYNALTFLDRESIISLSQEFSKKVSMQFVIPSKEVIRYISLNPNDEEVISIILRTYPGIFDMEIPINTAFVAKKSAKTEANVLSLLEKLYNQEIISYKAQNNDASIIFNEIREDERTINRIAKHLEAQNKLKVEQLKAVIDYISDQKNCKSQFLMHYFGEENPTECGICSACKAKNNTTFDIRNTAQQILNFLNEKPQTSRDIEINLQLREHQILQTLQVLLEENKIEINHKNEYFLKKN